MTKFAPCIANPFQQPHRFPFDAVRMRNDAESRLTIPVGAKERATVPLEGHSGNGPDNSLSG